VAELGTKMDDQPKSSPKVDAPRGFFPASVDDRGRLKLPVDFQQFLNGTGDQMLYVTSTDGDIARLYPISLWKENEKYLDELGKEDPAAADSLVFITQHYGAEAKMDTQGRVTLPTELRRELKLEGEVRVGCVLGAINIYSQEKYQAYLDNSRNDLRAKLSTARTKGFR
jgi:MraZ protein